MNKQYCLDPARIYISGCSGGGRAASWVAMGYPDVFSGGLYMIGADLYRALPNIMLPRSTSPIRSFSR